MGLWKKIILKIYDYNVPQRLREIYQNQDFGNYTQNGEIPVCFIATNHTTGGNSGSPVFKCRRPLDRSELRPGLGWRDVGYAI